MIASLTGRVASAGLDQVVVEVHGVGMAVRTPPAVAAAAAVGEQVTLATTLVVREDSLTLYGFDSPAQRDMFELVQTVSGVGPRLALAMCSVLNPAQLRRAFAGSDIATLTKVPGIGRKGAERLVLELKDRIAAVPAGADEPVLVPDAPDAGDAPAWRGQVEQALVGLGWTLKQAEAAVEKVADDVGPDPDVAAALKAALRELGR